MRHNKAINHLGRKSGHRKALLANMSCSLIQHKRITTTLAKAKALRSYVEPLITKSKDDSTHSRRIVFSYLKDKTAVAELFRTIAGLIFSSSARTAPHCSNVTRSSAFTFLRSTFGFSSASLAGLLNCFEVISSVSAAGTFCTLTAPLRIARVLGNDETCDQCPKSDLSNKAEKIVEEFFSKIPMIREYLYTDVQAAYDGDPAAYSTDEVIFSYPGIFAITVYRIAHELVLLGVPLIPRIMTEYAHSLTGIDINPGAAIGKYFCIDHGTGIVIGETTTIGDHVKIYQGVTLGALSTKRGQLLKGEKRHPTIGNNVTIYSGTSVLGGDTVIGDGVTIGGNAFIVNVLFLLYIR